MAQTITTRAQFPAAFRVQAAALGPDEYRRAVTDAAGHFEVRQHAGTGQLYRRTTRAPREHDVVFGAQAWEPVTEPRYVLRARQGMAFVEVSLASEAPAMTFPADSYADAYEAMRNEALLWGYDFADFLPEDRRPVQVLDPVAVAVAAPGPVPARVKHLREQYRQANRTAFDPGEDVAEQITRLDDLRAQLDATGWTLVDQAPVSLDLDFLLAAV